jgi:hypothetical protein
MPYQQDMRTRPVLLARRELDYVDVHVLFLAIIHKLSGSLQLQRQERMLTSSGKPETGDHGVDGRVKLWRRNMDSTGSNKEIL